MLGIALAFWLVMVLVEKEKLIADVGGTSPQCFPSDISNKMMIEYDIPYLH